MPTYPYICQACEHTCDVFQKITDASLTQCPQCGKETLKRGICGGNAVFRFQGNGFYQTDYKTSSTEKTSCCPCGKEQSCKS